MIIFSCILFRYLNIPPTLGFPGGTSGRECASSIAGLGRSPGVGDDNPRQYSCLENPMNRGAWWAVVHGATKSQTWLNNWVLNTHFIYSAAVGHSGNFQFVVVQLLSCIQLFATPWTEARQASLPFTVSQSLLKLTSIESVMPSNHLILCCPLLLLPSVFPSIRVSSSELTLHIRCLAKY